MDSQKYENILNLALDTPEEERARTLELIIHGSSSSNTTVICGKDCLLFLHGRREICCRLKN